jgi:hypothetical protein
MRTIDREFAYAVFRRFIDAVSAVDCSTLQTIATSDVHVEVPGTRSAYITTMARDWTHCAHGRGGYTWNVESWNSYPTASSIMGTS